jgi:hypothetical protein
MIVPYKKPQYGLGALADRMLVCPQIAGEHGTT